jgi:NAD(P)-dependent dehydrogenase (short-subunit alcohol dehydrogenase family)
MDTFDGRVSLVTGSSRGIDAAIATAFGQRPQSVQANGRSRPGTFVCRVTTTGSR